MANNNQQVETDNSEDYMVWLIEDKLEKIKGLDSRILNILAIDSIILAFGLLCGFYIMFFSWVLIEIIIFTGLFIPILILTILNFTKHQFHSEIDMSREAMSSISFRKSFRANLEEYFFEINDKYNRKKSISRTILILFSIQLFILAIFAIIMAVMYIQNGILQDGGFYW
ncbi:MAG: hypothetical protein ACFFDW_11065 [Candidatus Thorarchaeota archaeon]